MGSVKKKVNYMNIMVFVTSKSKKTIKYIFSKQILICLIIFFAQNNFAQSNSKPNLADQIKLIILSQIDSLHNEFVKMKKDTTINNSLIIQRMVGANESDINSFENSIKDLKSKIILGGDSSKFLQTKLNQLKLKKISALPMFYNLVHDTLQMMIDNTYNQKNIAAKKSLEPFLKSTENQKQNIEANSEVKTFDSAAASNKKIKKEFKDIEIEGLVVDETQTKLGHDFYDLFYQKWESPQALSDFTIIISEKPLPSLGTQVSIKINDTEIFENRLQTRYELIEELADYAVQLSMNYLQNYEEIQKELNGDEMKGSGIF